MFSIRSATLQDAAVITAQRRAMFADMGYRDERAMDEMAAAFLPWLRLKMEAGEYLAWLAIHENGSVAGGSGLWLMDWPPHMVGGAARRGNILNVYTRADFRRQGLARRLTQSAVDWCRENAIRAVILHASDFGRPLYQSLGFQSTNEMRLIL